MRIAIDGPAASGKSSVAKKIAQKNKLTYIDTGAMYRCITVFVQEQQISNLEVLENYQNIKITFDENNETYLNGINVENKIRNDQYLVRLSEVAASKTIRNFLSLQQRTIAQQNNVIMDGRDIGSHIMPDADLKFYITANSLVRAKRRYDQSDKKIPVDTIEAQIIKRDELDKTRKINPLVICKDAIVIDSSNLTLEETISQVQEIIERKKWEIQSQS